MSHRVDADQSPTFRLLVGLGNPGREYLQTRHNIGFMILEQLAQRASASFRQEPKLHSAVADRDGVLFCQPQSFMNRSGEPVASLSRFYKIEPREMLIVLDDVALPLGRLRLRAGGSSGGHNGLQSILDFLGTPDVPRLRVGIGAAVDRPLTNHVLGRFTAEEMPELKESLARAVATVDFAQQHGIEAAMNRFN